MSRGNLVLLAAIGMMVVLGLLAGCDQTLTPTPTQSGLGLAATVAPSSTLAPSPTPSPTPPAGPGPLPQVLARVPLAPPDESLDDLLLDGAANRLYVTDTVGQLHVLDATTYAKLATLPAAGNLVLDATGQRLYVSPEYDAKEVTIVDTNSLAVVGTVSPGGFVAVDDARDRFYVGNRAPSIPGKDAPGVRVYDAKTLENLGEIQQPGIPVYNPLRDELYIVAYTVYQVDPNTLNITGNLLPDVSPTWCNGCEGARNAYVFPERNLLVIDMMLYSAGHGGGKDPHPRFFDATTLTELTDLAQQPAVERGCRDRVILAGPVDGRVYRGEGYSRYQTYNNLLVYDLEGNLVTWRDGLSLGVTNPNTKQMYVAHEYAFGVLVLDLATLSPLGTLPALSCFYALDVEAGRIYALQGNDLLALSQSGGVPELPPAVDVDALPAAAVRAIRPSPDYRHDHTLFLYLADDQTNRFYRSRDEGQTWAQLRGGLPEAGGSWSFGLVVSPDFANDHALFAYGYRGAGFGENSWGAGVYRSTDSGDTWQPMWNGLIHLPIYDVVLSPDYTADGMLVACAGYCRIDPWETGYSIFRSTDRGLQWTLALTQSTGSAPPSPAGLLPGAEPDTRFRQATVEGKEAVERTTDGGQTWGTVLVLPSEPYTLIEAILLSPDFATDQMVYVLHSYGLLRSTDGGETWQKWTDDRLAGRDYKNELTTMALASLGDGKHQLFIGTAAGEFWVLDPATMTWEPLRD